MDFFAPLLFFALIPPPYHLKVHPPEPLTSLVGSFDPFHLAMHFTTEVMFLAIALKQDQNVYIHYYQKWFYSQLSEVEK